MDSNAPQGAASIRWVQIEDAIFILDLRLGQYFALGPEHVDPWLALMGRFPASAPPPAAVESLRQQVLSSGWLTPAQQAVPPSAPSRAKPVRRFRVVHAFGCMAGCMVALRVLGFQRTYSTVQRLAGRTTSTANASDIHTHLQLFQTAESFFFSHKRLEDCLPRSLALFLYLRRSGLPAEHHIGIRRYPFGAHAWVKACGIDLQRAVTHGNLLRRADSIAGDRVLFTDYTDIAVLQ